MTTFVWPTEGGSGGAAAQGALGISNASSGFTVSFADIGTTNYAVACSIECPDATPQFLQAIIQNKQTNSFDVLLNAPTDSANYKLNYLVTLT